MLFQNKVISTSLRSPKHCERHLYDFCFRVPPHYEGFTLKTHQLFSIHTTPEKSNDYRDVIVSKSSVFKIVFRPRAESRNAKLAYRNSSSFKSVFEKHRFRDGFVLTINLTVEIKLRFQILSALCGRGLGPLCSWIGRHLCLLAHIFNCSCVPLCLLSRIDSFYSHHLLKLCGGNDRVHKELFESMGAYHLA